ncbi:general secretion pathway protein GspD [Massilia sp. KIM]|uniref:secretin and TonB N-terminal domain-containing protein n=1 Tax=Massilia sp. KIM TaxID=1955422 RepID=UPI00098ED69D|nr:secretin and TonB N-terminal domain-containing protein [Massilia sp. KIM]OON63781.1 general secretion pathway protein GspD [Massilia sp. KIM]
MLRLRIKGRAVALVLPLALLLAGCAAQRAYQEGNALLAQDQVAAGLAKYQEAVAADPTNPLYKAAWLRARDSAGARLLEQADRLLQEGQPELALENYRRVLSFDPGNDRARAGLRLVESERRLGSMLAAAREAFDRNELDGARQKLGALLTERPGYEPARQLLVQVNEKALEQPAGEAALAAAYRKPISLEFRDAPLKQVFEIISRHSGLNFVFDKDVKGDQRTSIFLKNSTVEAAVYYLLMTNQLERQVMDGNTILIYPNIAAKLREYQEMTVKTFFLANADAKNIANTLKTILKARDVVIDEKLNLVILRDNPEAVRIATQLVALQDVPEPEVMLDVEVLEIKRSRIMDLGIQWPAAVSFAPLTFEDGAPLTIDSLRRLNRGSIAVSNIEAKVNANKTDGDTNTLANPRIRVRNKEKAKVVIGDKIPNISATVSTGVGGFASENVNYVDVGLTLNVEPVIYLNNEVAIRISLEVSTLGESVTTRSGSVAYRIGTRSATTLLQLKDGENQVLAGLISNEDRSSGSKIPGIGDLPIVGRLFGSTRDQSDRTEIVLSITPRLVRNIQRPPAAASEFGAGTEASFRRRPDNVVRSVTVPTGGRQPAAAGQQPAAPAAASVPASAPASAPAPTPAPAPAGVNAAPAAPAAPLSVPPSQLPSTPQLGSPPSGPPPTGQPPANVEVTPVAPPPPGQPAQPAPSAQPAPATQQ